MKRLGFIEFSLVIGLAVSLCAAAFASESQEALAGKLIRLHVIANSDSAEDQQLKLRVRDRVLELADAYTAHAENTAQARKIISENLHAIENAASEEIYASGYTYPVRAEITNMFFPTREYDTFSLPAGYYDSFRVIIGDGAGKNWWCVMFPPLCVSAAEEEIDAACKSAGLSEEERKLIANGETVYRCKFKAIELAGRLKNFLQKNS